MGKIVDAGCVEDRYRHGHNFGQQPPPPRAIPHLPNPADALISSRKIWCRGWGSCPLASPVTATRRA
jgi:hypothetical protein